MKYELKTLSCPSCGAKLEANIDGRDTIFCTYCGGQIAIDDGSTNININQHITNDAEIEREHRLEREHSKNQKLLVGIIIGCVVLIVLILIVLFFIS